MEQVVLVILALSNLGLLWYLHKQIVKLENSFIFKLESVKQEMREFSEDSENSLSAFIENEIRKIPKEIVVKNVLKVP